MDVIQLLKKYFSDAFSTPTRTAGQIIGFVAAFISLFAFVFVSRRKIIVAKLATDVLWIFSFVLCGAASGALTNAVNAAREGIFYFKKDTWKKLWFIPFAFIAFYIGSAVVTWNGAVSLLPMAAASASVMGMWETDPLYTKLWCLPALILWLIYSLAAYNIMSAVSNILALISVCVGLIREYKHRRNARV